MRYDVITFGSATLDVFLVSELFKVIRSARFVGGKGECVSFGSKIELDDMAISTGGGATNTAATFARNGFSVATVCKIGEDLAGAEIFNTLKKEKIASNFVIKSRQGQTGYSTLLVTKEGQRTVLVFRGLAEKMKETEIPWKKLSAKWFYITSLGGNVKLLKTILNFAEKNKIKVALNAGSREIKHPDFNKLLSKVALLITNREEAERIAGKRVGIGGILGYLGNLAAPASPAKRGGRGNLGVLTDGAKGAYACEKGKCYKVGIYPFKVKDATGAGDAFGSGFVAGLIKYGSVRKALQLAAWNASNVVTEIGAKAKIVRGFPKKPLRVSKLV